MDVVSFPGSGDAAGRASCPKHSAEGQEGGEEPCVPEKKKLLMSPEGCSPRPGWKATFSIRYLSSAHPSTGGSPSLRGPRPRGAPLAFGCCGWMTDPSSHGAFLLPGRGAGTAPGRVSVPLRGKRQLQGSELTAGASKEPLCSQPGPLGGRGGRSPLPGRCGTFCPNPPICLGHRPPPGTRRRAGGGSQPAENPGAQLTNCSVCPDPPPSPEEQIGLGGGGAGGGFSPLLAAQVFWALGSPGLGCLGVVSSRVLAFCSAPWPQNPPSPSLPNSFREDLGGTSRSPPVWQASVTLLLRNKGYFYPLAALTLPWLCLLPSLGPAPSPVPGWDPAAAGAGLCLHPPSTPQPGGMQQGPLPFVCGHRFCGPHPLPCAKLFFQPDK
ncbi:translation initiation factor IF-2-like [Grus americana]|uniref:translation initiation factor IF-2-like n=1 Tax=Grus americana TaxID=9117 RepID=UPI0024083B09|nr:translation initiation factor IF-2-like [Grus americana]